MQPPKVCIYHSAMHWELVLLKERIVSGFKSPVWLWNSGCLWWNHCNNNIITICGLVRSFIAGCLAFQKSYRCCCCIIHLVRNCHSCVLSCRFFQAIWQQTLVWAGQSTDCNFDGHGSGAHDLCLAGKLTISEGEKWKKQIVPAPQRFQGPNDNAMGWKWTCLVYTWMFPCYWNYFREPFQISQLKDGWNGRSEVSTPREIVEENHRAKKLQKRWNKW